jgi:deglycase
MTLEGKRVAVLIEDDYNLQEFTYPFYRLQEAGAEVKVVGTSRATTFSSHDQSVKADLPASEVRVDDFDAVVIPGGYAPDKMRRDKDMVAFVHDMDAAGKPVAAICHAGWMLVSAKIVKGRNATSFYSIRDGRGGGRRHLVGPGGGHRRQPDHVPHPRRPARLLPGGHRGPLQAARHGGLSRPCRRQPLVRAVAGRHPTHLRP